MFHEHKNTKLNHFSPISKVANFWVLHRMLVKHMWKIVRCYIGVVQGAKLKELAIHNKRADVVNC